MAIFIASTKSISRSSGQSAVASASYRAGVELEDKRYGKTHDYSKKHGVMSADIILPSALAAANAAIDRSDLWNKAELAEKRKDARVAREWLVNLPHELNEQDRKVLAHRFAQLLTDRYGTIADCAIHKPTDKEIARGADPRNYHAHIMFTTRTAALDDNFEIILTDKATIELSDTKRGKLGMERMSHEIKAVRQIWEHIANEKLAERNLSLIDSRSYADQGKDIEPQIKMGSVATKLERDKYEREREKAEQANKKGEVYEIDETPATIRGEINTMIAERNALILQAYNRTIFEKRDLNERLERTERFIDRADQRIDLSERWINSNSKRASRSEQNIEWARKRCENLPNRIDDTTQRINSTTQRIDSTASANDRLTQRIDGTKQSISSITSAIGRSDIEIDKAAELRARPASTPFDDNARRARAARLTEQKRQADRNARDYRDSDERVFDSAKGVPILLANKLWTRDDVKNRIRWESYETAENYPDKYDKRQIEKLDSLAQSLGLEKQPYDYRKAEEIASKFTTDFVEQHKLVFELLMNPKSERAAYDLITTEYHSFIVQLDAARAVENKELQQQLGSSETSRMTAETMTVTSYLNNLDCYINDEDVSEECKNLARENIAKTFTRTCSQYRQAYQDLKYLDSNESIQKHLQLLETSLNQFITEYGQRLSEDNMKGISVGQNVLQERIEIRDNYGSSFGFR